MKIGGLKAVVIFDISIFILCVASGFGYRIINPEAESLFYDLADSSYSVKIGENVFSVREDWEDIPKIKLRFSGEDNLMSTVKEVIESLGFFESEAGEILEINTIIFQGNRVYFNFEFRGKKVENSSELILIDDFKTELKEYLSSFFQKSPKRKIVAVHSKD